MVKVRAADVAAEEPGAPLTRADRKVIIQQGIVDAALALTERHGVDRWTMQMLAAELGWSTGAAYRHMSGKDDLLEQVAVEVLKRIEIPDPSTGDWESRLRALARSTWRELSRQRWVANYILSHAAAGEFANRCFGAPLVGIFSEAGFGLDTVSLPIGLYAAFIFGSVCGFETGGATKASPSDRQGNRRRSAKVKSYKADQHFEWGLDALVGALRAQVAAL